MSEDRFESILFARRQDLEAVRARVPLECVQRAAREAPPPRDFLSAVRSAPTRPALIAEIKRASPSQGELRKDLNPVALAQAYAAAGAAAISVLTEARHFHGSLDDLRAVRAAVSVPVLRKDFLLDEYMVWEARAAGADAVLLIVGALHVARLAGMHALAIELGMTPLVEVHAPDELVVAGCLSPQLVGVNNRDLRTMAIDTRTALGLRPKLPPAALCIAESGLETAADVAAARNAGFDGVLIGTALLRPWEHETGFDPGARIRRLFAS